ncbi:hypothetical protein [Actinobacillus porcinus]|uniref:hypothetical protein n=1 Tax=Actinobacillus porcinus TaxID=51048 RepID=UPI002A90E7F5|nr:hypothetical protein [Actinobacillus porcinus]MDY6216689.1 hypothetical protein [Actinobacillus porcinus]
MILVNDYLITLHPNAQTGEAFYMVSRRSNPNDQGESFDNLDDALCAVIAKFQAHLLLKSDELERSIKAQSHTVLRLTATTRPNIQY